MPVHDLVDEGCGIQVSIEAPEAPEIKAAEDDDSMHEISFAIPGGLVECFIYGEELDFASTLANMLSLTAEQHSDWYAVDETGASAIEGRPYLHATAITRTDDGEMRLWQNFHVAVGSAQFETFACVANGAGRRSTFLRIYERALQSLNTPATQKPEDLSYHSTSLFTSPGGGLAGFSDSYVYDESDGTTLFYHSFSRIFRAANLHLVGKDETSVERSIDGRVVSGAFVSATPQTLDFEIQLDVMEGDPMKYTAKGKVMGKDFETSFDTQDGLGDQRRETRAMSRFVKESSAKVISFTGYEPTADPSGLVTTFIERKERTSNGINATISVGAAQFPAQIDEFGELLSLTLDIGGTEVNVKRVWLEGSLLD